MINTLFMRLINKNLYLLNKIKYSIHIYIHSLDFFFHKSLVMSSYDNTDLLINVQDLIWQMRLINTVSS